MRIRKHAKISPLLYATSSLNAGALLQTHACQLNQSPWDVITFSPPLSPPPPFQVNGSDVRAGNGSSEHCVSVSERELTSRRRTSDQDTAVAPPPPPPPEENEAILCCKTDGKSWHCRRETAKGNSLCEHHLSMVKNYSNVAATKKPVKAARPKRAPAATSASNPYEFYYYSGFGPRWGKRRGETRKNSNGNSSMPKDVEMEPAAISDIVDEDLDFFTEYEDEEEEEERRDNGKKRVRKPIKARSLKSLL